MTLDEAYRAALRSLRARCREDCAFEVSCLFERAFGVARHRLPMVGDAAAPPDGAARFSALCERFAAGEPLQYLLGEWEFYGLPFSVGPGVLIPQPDTETLVEAALSLLEGAASPAVADLCAGSGAVAVALAHCRPDARVSALELSGDALPYLRENVSRNGVTVTVLRADVLDPPELPPLDLAVSNPPYIRRGDLPGLPEQVRREPPMALDGGPDGLDFYRALPALWMPRLKPGGALALEVGYDQADPVAALLESAGYVRVDAVRDLGGVRRVVHGRKPLL